MHDVELPQGLETLGIVVCLGFVGRASSTAPHSRPIPRVNIMRQTFLLSMVLCTRPNTDGSQYVNNSRNNFVGQFLYTLWCLDKGL